MPTQKQLRELNAARSRTKLAAVPDPEPEPAPAPVPPMPAEQPRKTTPSAKPVAAFPFHITLKVTIDQAGALDELCAEANAASMAAGMGKPYSVNPILRAVIANLLEEKNDRLRAKVLKDSLAPQHTGRRRTAT